MYGSQGLTGLMGLLSLLGGGAPTTGGGLLPGGGGFMLPGGGGPSQLGGLGGLGGLLLQGSPGATLSSGGQTTRIPGGGVNPGSGTAGFGQGPSGTPFGYMGNLFGGTSHGGGDPNKAGLGNRTGTTTARRRSGAGQAPVSSSPIPNPGRSIGDPIRVSNPIAMQPVLGGLGGLNLGGGTSTYNPAQRV